MKICLKGACVAAPCKYELYISILLPLLTTPYYAVLPRSYHSSLIGVGVFSLAIVCALNALLDWKRMHWMERIIAVPWFCLLAVCLPLAIWNISHIGVFADR